MAEGPECSDFLNNCRQKRFIIIKRRKKAAFWAVFLCFLPETAFLARQIRVCTVFFTLVYFFLCRLVWNISKGNQAPTQKFERTNQKILKSKSILTSVNNWCHQLAWKLNEAISLKILIESKQIKTNENQRRFLSFYI